MADLLLLYEDLVSLPSREARAKRLTEAAQSSGLTLEDLQELRATARRDPRIPLLERQTFIPNIAQSPFTSLVERGAKSVGDLFSSGAGAVKGFFEPTMPKPPAEPKKPEPAPVMSMAGNLPSLDRSFRIPVPAIDYKTGLPSAPLPSLPTYRAVDVNVPPPPQVRLSPPPLPTPPDFTAAREAVYRAAPAEYEKAPGAITEKDKLMYILAGLGDFEPAYKPSGEVNLGQSLLRAALKAFGGLGRFTFDKKKAEREYDKEARAYQLWKAGFEQGAAQSEFANKVGLAQTQFGFGRDIASQEAQQYGQRLQGIGLQMDQVRLQNLLEQQRLENALRLRGESIEDQARGYQAGILQQQQFQPKVSGGKVLYRSPDDPNAVIVQSATTDVGDLLAAGGFGKTTHDNVLRAMSMINPVLSAQFESLVQRTLVDPNNKGLAALIGVSGTNPKESAAALVLGRLAKEAQSGDSQAAAILSAYNQAVALTGLAERQSKTPQK